MRNFIGGISIVFYVLAGIITFKALIIPDTHYQSSSENLRPEDPPPEQSLIDNRTVRTLAVLGDGMFGTGQDVVSENLKNTIRSLINDIAASPDYRVLIEGHTDNIPIKSSIDKRYIDNMELSFLRAKAVSQILVENGIPLNRISVTGYGDSRPLASNDTDGGRAKNRRVEVKLIPENKEF